MQVSAGELDSDAAALEYQLVRIFDMAAYWNAILLFDECDVYLKQRDGVHLERNRLVSIFLRTLEYYPGIFILTTNMFEELDRAVLDRVHLPLRYDNLTRLARRRILERVLKAVGANIQEEDLDTFAETEMDGRQVSSPYDAGRAVTY